MTIETCVNPVSALSRLRTEPFPVVLSDFNMPDMNSIALLRAARECGSDASFILMTGDSTADMLTQGLPLGRALVNKPLNRGTLFHWFSKPWSATGCGRTSLHCAERSLSQAMR